MIPLIKTFAGGALRFLNIKVLTAPIWAWLCSMAMIVAILGGFHHLGTQKGIRDRDAYWQPQVAQLNQDLGACRTDRDSYAAQIRQHNGEVKALKTASDAQVKAAEDRLKAQLKVSEKYQAEIKALGNAKPTNADMCISAQTLMVDVIREEQAR